MSQVPNIRRMSANIRRMTRRELAVLPHGWVRHTADGWTGYAYLRYEPDTAGRWILREMYLDCPGGLSHVNVNGLDLAFIEAWVNELGDQLSTRYDEAVADQLAVLASHIGTRFYEAKDATNNWVAAAYFSSFNEAVRKDYGLGHLEPPTTRKHRRGAKQVDSAYRLTHGPEEGRLSDEFLAEVGRAYIAALARKERPNKTIAKDTGQDKRTVEGWVAKARRRGIMPPAKKGVAG